MAKLLVQLSFIWLAIAEDIRHIPLIGFGTAWGVNHTHARIALECGYELLDTAQAREWYDEVGVGQALRSYEKESRKQAKRPVFITTKLDPRLNGYESALTAFETSIKNLGRVDAFLLHYPHCPEKICKGNPPPGNWLEAWRALELLYEQSRVSVIGVCNFDLKQLQELVEVADTPPMLVQNWMDPLHQDRAVRDFCRRHNIFYQAYSSLGLKHDRTKESPVLNHATIQGIAARHNTTTAAVILKWQLQSGVGVIPRSTNRAHICDNLERLRDPNFVLTSNDMETMDGLEVAYLDRNHAPVAARFSKAELKTAVEECLKLSPSGDCFDGPHGPIGEWDISGVTDMSLLFFSANSFQGDISKWDVSSVTDMSSMFRAATLFNGDISKWDVSSVTDMGGIFFEAKSFNGDISKWDVSSVTNMHGIFWGAEVFNSDVSKWDLSSVTDMRRVYFFANAFNRDISQWDVSSAKNMHSMFWGAKSFKGDLSKWDVSSATNMNGMFRGATTFKGDLSKWDVSSVTTMEGMFRYTSSFNGDLSEWNVSRVSKMQGMFWGALVFNGDISKWDVSSGKDMYAMFRSAKAFNGDISKWDVSSVTNMNYMFQDTTSFKQRICMAAWVHSKASKRSMFTRSPGSLSRTVCTSSPKPATTLATHEHVSRRPIPERELIVRTPITTTIANAMACPRCSTFEKSGRASCCAPGGAWYNKCGGVGNSNVDHRWFDGVQACKPITTMTIGSVCPKCGTIKKSGKSSCCGRGGSWSGNCGSKSNLKLRHTWYEGIHACKIRSQSKRAIGQQSNSAEQKITTDSSHGAGVTNSIKSITMPDHTPMKNISTNMIMNPPSQISVSTSIITEGNEQLFNIAVHISLLLIIGLLQC